MEALSVEVNKNYQKRRENCLGFMTKEIVHLFFCA